MVFRLDCLGTSSAKHLIPVSHIFMSAIITSNSIEPLAIISSRYIRFPLIQLIVFIDIPNFCCLPNNSSLILIIYHYWRNRVYDL